MADDRLPTGYEYLLQDLYVRLEERDRWTESAIKFLLYTNGGGISASLVIVGLLANQKLPVPPELFPLIFFTIGIIIAGAGIYVMARNVRKGRRLLRPKMVAVLQGNLTYSDAFAEIGHFPSKWRFFTIGFWLSFSMFLCGLIATTAVLATTQWTHQNITGPMSTHQAVVVDRDSALERSKGVAGATLPPRDQHRGSAQAIQSR